MSKTTTITVTVVLSCGAILIFSFMFWSSHFDFDTLDSDYSLSGNVINDANYVLGFENRVGNQISALKKIDIVCHGIHRVVSGSLLGQKERELYFHELGFDLLQLAISTPAKVRSELNTNRSSICRRNTFENPQKNILMCGVIKNQAHLIEEFLSFHWVQGFDHFVVYDDNSTDNVASVVSVWEEKGIVTFLPSIKTRTMQYSSYKDCFDRYGAEYSWVVFLDFDEFVTPLQQTCLVDILANYTEYGGLAVNWGLFETARTIFNDDLFHIEQTNYSLGVYSPLVKSFCASTNTREPAWNMPHCCSYKQGFYAVDERKEYVACWSRNNSLPQRVIQITHYRSLSLEEHVKKLIRDVGKGWLGSDFESIDRRCRKIFHHSKSVTRKYSEAFPNLSFLQKIVQDAKYVLG
jgi:hypothetical protein